jgi:hypothetical protein
VGEPQVKGVWFVTARRHLLEHHGEAALAAVVAAMPEPERSALASPLPSRWFPEPVFKHAIAAVQSAVTANDDVRFLSFMEACAHIGVNHFLSIVLRITSPEFLLRKMPALWGLHRRHHGTLVVDAGPERARLTYAGFPYFDDRNYRLVVIGVLTKVLELCTGTRPRVAVAAHSQDTLEVEVTYLPGHR